MVETERTQKGLIKNIYVRGVRGSVVDMRSDKNVGYSVMYCSRTFPSLY